jgi:hypothetical protein
VCLVSGKDGGSASPCPKLLLQLIITYIIVDFPRVVTHCRAKTQPSVTIGYAKTGPSRPRPP